MTKNHKHFDLIVAWAKGANIEENLGDPSDRQDWKFNSNPAWLEDGLYRVAHPKLTKFVVSLTKTIEVIVEAISPEEAFQQAYKADKYNNKAWLETRCSKSFTELYREPK